MSEIHVKMRKEPIIVDRMRALKIQEFFDDKTQPDYQPLTIENWSGRKGDIRSIWIEPIRRPVKPEKEVVISDEEKKRLIERGHAELRRLKGII